MRAVCAWRSWSETSRLESCGAVVRVATRRRQRALTVALGAARAAAPVFGHADELEASGPLGEGRSRCCTAFAADRQLCSERALLLVVDDLHWCDSASLRFLAYLARRLEDLPVVLVASLRSSEPRLIRRFWKS